MLVENRVACSVSLTMVRPSSQIRQNERQRFFKGSINIETDQASEDAQKENVGSCTMLVVR